MYKSGKVDITNYTNYTKIRLSYSIRCPNKAFVCHDAPTGKDVA